MPLLQGVQRKEKTVPEEFPGADRGVPPFGPSWPEVLNGRPGACLLYTSRTDRKETTQDHGTGTKGTSGGLRTFRGKPCPLRAQTVSYTHLDVYKRQV